MGTALCRRLEAAGHSVVKLNSKNCDLRARASLDAFSGVKYDRIWHLAAWTQAGDFCLRHPGEQWLINQQINTNVLDWWRAAQPQAKLVCMGTSCSYEPGSSLKEENYLKGMPIDSLFTYAMTKRMLYAGALALNKQFGLNYLCLVPSTLYGPGYHTDGRQMHFIFDLIRKIARGKLYGDKVELWGDGSQRRELVHADDFTATALKLDAICDNQLVNIGSGEEFTIRHFAELICRKLAYDPGLIKYDESRYVGAKSKCLDITKLKGLLPGLTQIPLTTGLDATVDWFLKEKDKLL
jgi:GDP-L-fucose synthase